MSQLIGRFLSTVPRSPRAPDLPGAGPPTDDAIGIRDDAGAHPFAELVRGASAVGAALVANGVRPGDRVALLVHPSAAFVSAFFGVLLAGGCVLVLSPLHPAPETHFFCTDAAVRIVLVSAPLRGLATSLEDAFDVRAVEPLLQGEAGAAMPAIDEDAPALQLYTSGTTGKPKGAILTHKNLAVQQRLVGEAWSVSDRDVLLHALPLHHMHGLAIALLTALGAGACTTFRPFAAADIWNAMADATMFMGVPAMYHRLFAAFDAASAEERARWATNARGLRLATSGSAALPVTLAERWRTLTGVIPLERFGMTEIGVGLTNTLAGPRFPGCVGFPLPTVETRIVGDAPEHADAETGELWIRGPSVFAGYHRREDANQTAFVADALGGSPWFRTGDTVIRDRSLEGGPFRILGRTSVDILKSGGYKLSALEIEEVLREHPAVSEVAIVGIADEAWGDKVVACVVRRGNAPCEASDLKAFTRERLAPYKVPKSFIFMDELPKNALGKVVKPELVRQLADIAVPTI